MAEWQGYFLENLINIPTAYNFSYVSTFADEEEVIWSHAIIHFPNIKANWIKRTYALLGGIRHEYWNYRWTQYMIVC